MVWSQLELEKPHIAYACVGIFSTLFSLVSLFVKERLYIGEATVATIAGLILGPHCLDWFNPVEWGNTDFITLEICRIVLCIQIVAVAVELPRKYMKKHWVSVAIFLLPVMTCGWLVVGLFIWVLIPHFNFSDALLVSACVTATDPVLAAAVVGKGKFAERVPGHLRNLLSAESGCNDGMAFPFIFLSLNIVLYKSDVRHVIKDWFLLTILWECVFGCLLGAVLGYVLRKLVAFAEKKNLIDRESFLAIFVFLAFNSAGIGSMLGVDDLLVSFAAGTAFGWNGDFAKKTEESHVSTVIDLLLNLAFFVYFGAIVPWPQFDNAALGLDAWRLVILAIVVVFLRRVPAVVALKPFTPDVKTWREAFFCGHFGPIGVGAIFAAILARKDLEAHYTDEETPLAHLPNEEHPHFQLLAAIWPIVCFIVITSIVVHGSSVAVLTLGKRLNRMAITMSFTITDTQDQGPAWMSRLQKLDKASTSFSLHRVDTEAPSIEAKFQPQSVETSGIKVRPAGGAKRRKNKKLKKRKAGAGSRIKKTLSRVATDQNELSERPTMERQRPQTEVLQLGSRVPPSSTNETTTKESYDDSSSQSLPVTVTPDGKVELEVPYVIEKQSGKEEFGEKPPTEEEKRSIPTTAFKEGDKIIIEDQNGEILETLPVMDRRQSAVGHLDDNLSVHSMDSLRRHMSQYSSFSEASSSASSAEHEPIKKKLSRTISGPGRKVFYNKSDPHHRKVYAHQIDDLIVIENEDGEIIRRYKVNRHGHASKVPTTGNTRRRGSTIVNKALNLVGIKGKDESQQPDVPQIRVEGDAEISGGNILVPEKDLDIEDSPLKNPNFEGRLESKLTNILTKGSGSKAGNVLSLRHASRGSPAPDEIVEESEIDDDEDDDENESLQSDVTDEEDDDDDDDEAQETAVEKRRRLAALGKLPNRRDDDDEED
ncbi:Na+/H+ antiporter [Scheffersomyces xylosifermentans]|uniref:Na+/H+ antiporter n=1 Tax=Scheffersomyces xylosifermentans TaxID=1304137 RepID=UPI00315D3A9C